MVVIRQPDQKFVSEGLRTGLKVAVLPLCDAYSRGDLLLRQIGIFAEVSNSIVHAASPPGEMIQNYSIDEICLLTFR